MTGSLRRKREGDVDCLPPLPKRSSHRFDAVQAEAIATAAPSKSSDDIATRRANLFRETSNTRRI